MNSNIDESKKDHRKIIYTFWASGWGETLPPLVKRCRKSWLRNNPTWDIRFLDKNTPEFIEVLDMVKGKDIPIQNLTDILRVLLLKKTGGIWVDGTTLCLKPLDDWLDLDKPFLFTNDPIALWFMWSPKPMHHLYIEWFRNIENYWGCHDSVHRYFWLKDCLPKGAEFNTSDATIPNGPHTFVNPTLFSNPPEKNWLGHLIKADLPMVKLNWRHQIRPDSTIDLLMKFQNL